METAPFGFQDTPGIATIESAYALDKSFQQKWDVLPPDDLASSLTLSGNVSILSACSIGAVPLPRLFNCRVLDSFSSMSVVIQGWVLRQLQLYYKCLSQMYSRFTTCVKDAGLDFEIVSIFVQNLNRLTENTEMEIIQILRDGGTCPATAFERRTVVSDPRISDIIAYWIIEHFHCEINYSDVSSLATELNVDPKLCYATVQSRLARLREFQEDQNKTIPRWIPTGITSDRLSKILSGETSVIEKPLLSLDEPSEQFESQNLELTFVIT